MSLNFVVECDGCPATVKLINKSLDEAPEGWATFTINAVTLHACSRACAEKAALKAVVKLFSSKTAT